MIEENYLFECIENYRFLIVLKCNIINFFLYLIQQFLKNI